MTLCFATWSWDQAISPDQAAGPGLYRVKVLTAQEGALPYTADFLLQSTGGGAQDPCPQGCGGLEVTFTNVTSRTLDTADLSYTVEREVEGQWGQISAPQPVPTDTLRLALGQTLTWTWGASDSLGQTAPEGEYRVVLGGE